MTHPLAEAIRGFDSGFGLGFVVGPLARSAAVWCKSFVFASYPQTRRSYYLFFNYLFFNYLFFNYLSSDVFTGLDCLVVTCFTGTSRLSRGDVFHRGKLALITGTCG